MSRSRPLAPPPSPQEDAAGSAGLGEGEGKGEGEGEGAACLHTWICERSTLFGTSLVVSSIAFCDKRWDDEQEQEPEASERRRAGRGSR